MKNFYIFDFDGEYLKNNINLINSFNTEWETKKVFVKDYVCDNGLNFLKKIKIIPHHYNNLFIGPPTHTTAIHVDGFNNTRSSYALNYCWGSNDWSMSWFNVLNNNSGLMHKTTASTPYLTFNRSQVDEIERIDNISNKLLLVRIDVPHSVCNKSTSKRYCLSVRGNPMISWQKIVNYFDDFLIK